MNAIAPGAVECADIEVGWSPGNTRQTHPCIAFWAMRLPAGGERGAGRATRNKFPPSAVRRVGVQPTLVPKECAKRRGCLSKLVPLRTPWKGSGKTQNVAPFFDKVREPVTRIKRRPQIGIGRQICISHFETRPMVLDRRQPVTFGTPLGCFGISHSFMSAARRSCPAFLMASDRFDPDGNFFAFARA